MIRRNCTWQPQWLKDAQWPLSYHDQIYAGRFEGREVAGRLKLGRSMMGWIFLLPRCTMFIRQKYLWYTMLGNVRVNINWIVSHCGVELLDFYQVQPTQMMQVILTDIIITALVGIRLSMTYEHNIKILLIIYVFSLLWLHYSIQLVKIYKPGFLSKTKTVNIQFV